MPTPILCDFSEPVLFHKLSELYLDSHKRILRFHKPSRFSLGIRIENTVLEIIELSYLALSKQKQSKLLILNKIDTMLKMLSMHLRLAHKTQCLNDAGFAELSEKRLEIGRMIGNWIKETNNDKMKTAQEVRFSPVPSEKA